MILNNKSGSAIVMALIATIGVTILSYTVISRSRLAKKDIIATTADKDLEEAVAKIGISLITPSNCNANFFDKPTSGSLTEFRICPSGNCATVGAGASDMRVLSASDTNWKGTSYAAGGTGISERLRINSITYAVTTAQAQAPQKAAIVTVTVTFQQNLGFIPKADPDPNTERRTKTVVKTFEAFVKTHTLVAGAMVPHPTGRIYGCTKSPNSSSVYGL